jgi:hypothetical protein
LDSAPSSPRVAAVGSVMQELGHGRRARGAHWSTEDYHPEFPGARKTAATRISLGHGKPPRPENPWGTENHREPDIPGARKIAASRISLGHGRRRPGYPWGTEDGSPDVPGSRRTSTKLDGGTGGVPSCTTIVPAVSGAEPPELDVPRMKKGRVSFFRRMRNRSEQSKAGCSYGNFRRLAK